MTYQPGNPTRTRELLAALAVPPEPQLGAAWANELRALTAAIRATVDEQTDPLAGTSDRAALAYITIYGWRSDLDRHLTAVEYEDPALWAHARTPGTWLDALLRLRVVLTHVISKAYWSGHGEIRYRDIEIERYLWGAR